MAFRSRPPARLLLLLTAVLLALTTAAPAFAALNPSVWSDAVDLTTRSGSDPISGRYTTVTVDGSGNTVALWRSEVTAHSLCSACIAANGNFETWSSVRIDGSWSDPVVVPSPDGYFTMQATQVVTLPDGDVLGVYSLQNAGFTDTVLYANRWDAAAQTWDSGQWVVAQGSDTFAISSTPLHVFGTSTGAIVVFIDLNNNRALSWIRYNAANDSWGSLQASTTAVNMMRSSEFSVIDSVGTVFVVWGDDDSDIYYATAIDSADNQSAVVEIDDSGLDGDEMGGNVVQLKAFNTTPGVLLAYKDGNDDIRYRTSDDGSGWSDSVLIGTPTGSTNFAEQPAVAIDGDDNVTIMIDQNTNTTIGKYALASKTSDGHPDQGGTWPANWTVHTDETTTNAYLRYAQSAVTAGGSVVFIVAYEDASNYYVELLPRVRSGDWLDLVPITSIPADSLNYVRMVLDADDVPTLVWEWLNFGASGTPREITGSTLTAPLPVPDSVARPAAAAAPRFECLTGPTLTAEQPDALSIGGSTTMTVTVSNPHRVVQGRNDVMMSLADGLTAVAGDQSLLNLGQRVALQGLELDPGQTRSFTVTVQAGEQLVARPEYVAEVYCGGRVIQSVSSTFSGSIETTWTALVNGLPLPGTAAEPTTADSDGTAAVGTVSPVLPASLPNTAGAALPLAGLAAAAVAAIAVGRRITR